MKRIFFAICFLFFVQYLQAQNRQIDSLKQLLLQAKEDTSLFKTLLRISSRTLFFYSDTAVLYAEKAMLLAKKLEDPKRESEALRFYGAALMVTGNYPLSIDYLLKGLHIEEKLKTHRITEFSYRKPFLQIFYYDIAAAYRDEGDYEHALSYYNKAQMFPRNSQDDLRESLMNLSLLYEKFDQLDSALLYGKKAYDVDIKMNGKGFRAPIYVALGNVYYKKKNYSLALHYYRMPQLNSAFNFANKDVMELYNGMAKAFSQAGKIDSGIYYAQKALNLQRFISYPLATLNTYSILTDIYKKEGKSDSVVKYLEQTILLRDRLFSKQKEKEVHNLSFNEKLRGQEIIAERQQLQNKIKLYSLLITLAIFLLIAFLLYRNNRHKQKANVLLRQQKEKIESTLSELKSTQAQLIQSEKMASLGELTAGIAHEIQNPLNFVNNFSEVNKELLVEMKDEIDKGNIDDAKAIANDIIDNEEKINHHGRRADAIVKGMLQHSRTSSGQKQPTDINALCDEYLRLAYHGLRTKDKSFNAKSETDFDNSIGKINIIPQDIGRVVLNLIYNAFYAVNEKQKQNIPDYVPVVTVTTKKVNGNVEIMVKDNGNGIPKKILDKIFQPFFTTKPTGQGTGLGLSLAYDIVKAHGGELKVETKEGEGAEFIVLLPA